MKKVLLKQLSLLCLIIAMAAIYKPVKAQQGNDSIGMGWYYEMYQSGGNFLDIKNRAEQFFANHPDYDTVAELKNQYLDWLRFNRDRAHWVDSAAAPGDLNSANKAMSKILSEKSYSNQTPYESDWKLRSVDEWNTQNLGIITCIWQDPNNSNLILAGTEASGLWRTEDGGNTWVNITDSYFASDIPNTTPERIPLGFGVSSIAVVNAYNNKQYIVISTYLPKTTGISSYAVGLIATVDNGNTWNKITNTNIPVYNSDLTPIKLNCFKVIAGSTTNARFFASFGEYIYRIYLSNNNNIINVDECKLILDLHANINNVNYHIEDSQLPAVKNNIRDMELINTSNGNFLFVSTDGFLTSNNVKSDAKVFYCSSLNQTNPTLNANWYNLNVFQSTAISFVDYIAIDSYNGDCFFAYNKQPLPITYNNVETFYIDKYQKQASATVPWFKPLGWDCSKTHQNNYTVGPILAGFGTRYNGFKVINGTDILVGGYELNKIKNYNDPSLVDFSIFHAQLNGNENYAINNSYHYGIRTIEKFNENLIGTDGGISRVVWQDMNSIIASVNNINNKGLAISQINSMTTTKNSNHDIIVNNAYRNGLWQYKCDKWDNYYWEDGGNLLLDEIDRDLNDNGEPDYVHNFTANINWSFPMYPYIQLLNYCTFPNCLGTSGIYPSYINLTSQGAYSNNLESNYNTPMEFSNSTNDNVLHGLHNIYQSSDFGQTWSPITANAVNNYPQPNYWSGSLEVIRVSQNNPNIMYIAFSNPTYNLDQDGTTAGSKFPLGKIYRGQKGHSGTWYWFDITAGISNLTPNDLGRVLKYTSITDIAINPYNSDEIWVSFNNYDGTNAITGKYRVLRYNYNTNVWTDYSDGLTAAPVNCITINKYSNLSELFVGTDIGVFYRNANMNKWELFHKSNPKWIVTDLSINYEKMLLRAATWGRSIWETPINCVVDQPHDYTIYQADNGTTLNNWTNLQLSNVGDIEIMNGAVLTINASTIEMAKNKRIIVNRGGTLIINNNSKITGYCKRMWTGIEIDGKWDESQSSAFHAKVVISNSEIRDALIAAKCFDFNFPDFGGGIIQATNASFYNNQIAVKLLPYSYQSPNNGMLQQNLSYFYLCNFITDAPLKEKDLKPIVFITCSDINNLKIWGCNFKNINQNCDGLAYEGIGIESFNSYIDVDGYCNVTTSLGVPCPETSLIPSTFLQLDYGIKAIASIASPIQRINVKNSIFEDNKRGLYMDNINNFYILSNKFYIPNYYNALWPNPAYNILDCYYGAYLNSCQNNYHFEDNKFSYNINGNGGSGFIGLYINDTRCNNELIYNNTFDYLQFGIVALGENKYVSENPDDAVNGLKIKCNDFIDCNNNIAVVTEQNPSGYQGIAYFQGFPSPNDPTKPAGNTFDITTNITSTVFYNDACYIEYTHHDHPIAIPSTSNVAPGSTNTINSNILYNKSTACPPKYINTGVLPALPVLYSNITLAQQQLNSANLILCIWKDNGNTEALKQAVDLALPYEAYALYNELMMASPYLSEAVLIKAIENEAVLPPLMLKMILLANPHAAKSQKVMDALLKRQNPFPKVWIDELNDNTNFLSPMEQLRGEVDYAATLRQQAYNDIKSAYISDTSLAEFAADSLIALLERENRLETDIELLYLHLANKNTDAALTLYEQIPLDYNMETEYNAVLWSNTVDIYKILIDLIKNKKPYTDIAAEDLITLRSLAKDNFNNTAAIARNILIMADTTYRYQEPIVLPFPEPQNKTTKPEKIKISAKDELMLYPNPANDFATISYQISEPLNNLQLIISDAMGKVVYTQKLNKASDQILIVMKDYAKGNYLAGIFNADKLIKSCKFVLK